MKRLLFLVFLLSLLITPFCNATAQKVKDEIVMPQFPGGESELHSYIVQEFKFPMDARVKRKKGEILVAFTIGANGYVSGVRVVRSVSKALDAEAVRVISSMPPWIPGKKNGRPVRAEMSMPINIKYIYENKAYVNEEEMDRVIKEAFSF